MRVLLDTHACLWVLQGDPQLSRAARTIANDLQNQLYLSVASLWEMAIKVGKGSLLVRTASGEPFERAILEDLRAATISVIGITAGDAMAMASLPLGTHKDPFDRMIAAQCLRRRMVLLGRDAQFDQYRVRRVW